MLDSVKEYFSNVTLKTLIPAILICVISLIIASALKKAFARLIKKSKLSIDTYGYLEKIFNILVDIIVVLIVAGAFGIDTSPLIALLSVAALALSLSVQGFLTNVINGLALLTGHPFQAGDFVEIDGVSGTVNSLDLTHVSLITADNKIIWVPNSNIVGSRVTNYTSSGKRRVDLTFTASYDDDPEKVKAALLKACDVKSVLPDMERFARVSNYGDNAIEYAVRVWTTSAEYWNVHFDIIEKVKQVFDEEQITMTYPHLNVHLDNVK